MKDQIIVEVASYRVEKNSKILSCLGLGSCLGIAIYDPRRRIGGLAHAMLPKFQEGRNRKKPEKYVDTAIYIMIDEMIERGCLKRNLVAKLVGGASMFIFTTEDALNIGGRNTEVARETMDKEKIEIKAEEVGGNSGRTMNFDLKNGKIQVKKIGKKPICI
jgi:chemotaxis protein CheD